MAVGTFGCQNKVGRAGKAGGAAARQGRKLPEHPDLTVQMSQNQFTVDDETGVRLLEADVQKTDGKMAPGMGLEGVVKMAQARCRLFKKGKLEMTFDTAAATWDGKQLVSQAPVHAVTAAQDKIIDAQQGTWTAKTSRIDMQTARLQSIARQKVEFTADAPRATVVDKVATMNAGAAGKSAAGDTMRGDRVKWHFDSQLLEADGNAHFANTEGSTLDAARVQWNLGSGKLTATGAVRLSEEGTVVTGQRLAADTKLKRGRLSGGTRVVMKRGLPLKRAAKKNG